MAARLEVVLLALALPSAACVDAAPVGVIECGARFARCGLPNVRARTLGADDLPANEYPSSGVQTVSATWSREFHSDVEQPSPRLVVDSSGELGLIRPELDRLTILHLDRNGEVIDSVELEGPGKLSGAQPWPQMVETPVGYGPLIVTDWYKACPPSVYCEHPSEFIALEELGHPRRFAPTQYLSATQVVASESDVWLIHDEDYHSDARIESYDYDGELRWRRAGLLKPSGGWMLHGAVQGRNQLRVLVGATSGTGAELWTMDERGDIESLVHLAISWEGWPRPVVDARGRLHLIGAVKLLNGSDLYLLRLGNNGELEGGIVLQEGYVPLLADTIATDREGAVYVSTATGGRDRASVRPTLCRMDDAANIECFALASDEFGAHASIHDMAVPKPGLVYAMIGNKLMRFDLPD